MAFGQIYHNDQPDTAHITEQTLAQPSDTLCMCNYYIGPTRRRIHNLLLLLIDDGQVHSPSMFQFVGYCKVSAVVT